MGKLAIASIGLLVTACGAATVDNEHERTDRELAPMHGTLGAFHDAFAPIYHMDKGTERDSRACTSTGDFEARADAVVKDLRADKDPPFKARGAALRAQVGELEAACLAHEGVEAKLEAMHDAFHAALEAAHEGEVAHDEKDEAAHGHDTNHR